MSQVKEEHTSKNKTRFIVENYLFEVNKKKEKNGTIIYYTNCINKRIKGCKATCVIVKSDDDDLYIKSEKNDHNQHPPPASKILDSKFKTYLYNRISDKNDTESMNILYKKSVQKLKTNVGEEDFSEFNTSYNNVQASMYRFRNKTLPKLPRTYKYICEK